MNKCGAAPIGAQTQTNIQACVCHTSKQILQHSDGSHTIRGGEVWDGVKTLPAEQQPVYHGPVVAERRVVHLARQFFRQVVGVQLRVGGCRGLDQG